MPQWATEGDVITIVGKHLTGVAQITFGGTPAKNFTIANDSTIYATVDTGSTGAVRIFGTDGSAMQGDGFVYTPPGGGPPVVYSIYPSAAAAGQSILIKGTHLSNLMYVIIGDKSAQSFTVTSDTTVVAVVAPNSTGTQVAVQSYYGLFFYTGFTYLPYPLAPRIKSAAPMTAKEGDTVNITGNHLAYVTDVSFGSVPASFFSVSSDTTMTAIVGAGNSGDIILRTAGGADTLAGFTYIPALAAARTWSDLHQITDLHAGNGESDMAISLYPNPASGAAWVKHPAAANARIKVINVMGGLVKLINVAPGATQTQLPLGGLQPGYYKVSWINGADTRTGTIIVK